MMAVIEMSDRDLARPRTLIDLVEGRLTVAADGELMGLGRRQVFRLRRTFAGDVSRERSPEQSTARRGLAAHGPCAGEPGKLRSLLGVTVEIYPSSFDLIERVNGAPVTSVSFGH
jgi:hypothetical protein